MWSTRLHSWNPDHLLNAFFLVFNRDTIDIRVYSLHPADLAHLRCVTIANLADTSVGSRHHHFFYVGNKTQSVSEQVQWPWRSFAVCLPVLSIRPPGVSFEWVPLHCKLLFYPLSSSPTTCSPARSPPRASAQPGWCKDRMCVVWPSPAACWGR